MILGKQYKFGLNYEEIKKCIFEQNQMYNINYDFYIIYTMAKHDSWVTIRNSVFSFGKKYNIKLAWSTCPVIEVSAINNP